MNKKITFTIFAFILIILLSQTVLSIGVTPAKKIEDYNQKIISKFSIYNNENKDFIAEISFEGKLAEYATIEENKLFINKEDKYTHFEVELNLPKLNSGKHILNIEILEKSPGSGSTLIGVNSAVEAKLEINVPYDGKYIGAKINTFSENQNLIVSIPVVNEGNEEINSVYAEVKVFDEDDNFIQETKTDTKSLSSKSQTTLTAKINNILFGSYKITSKIIYDEEEKDIDQEIDHGKKSIKINEIKITDFKEHNYIDLGLNLKNEWNGKQNNVFMELEVYDEEDNIVDTIKSINFNLEKDEERDVNIYWDIKDNLPGNYRGQLNIVSEGLDETVSMGIQLKSNSVTITYNGEKSSNKIKVDIILAFIIVIIVINIIFVILHIKHIIKHKKNR